MISIKKIAFYVTVISLIGCRFENDVYHSLGSEKQVKIKDTVKFLESTNNIENVHDILYKWYKNRNNLKVKKLSLNYKESLTGRIPVNNDNIDSHLQIDYFLGFLDSRFNNESIYQMFNNSISPSSSAFEYNEYPFDYEKDKIDSILKKISLKKQDSLWVKYYLREEGINNMLIFYDNDKEQNIHLYDSLLTILKIPPLNINFNNTKELIIEISENSSSINQWQGTYSFGYGSNRMGESSEGTGTFYIGNTTDVTTLQMAWETINDDTGALVNSGKRTDTLEIASATRDTLKLTNNTNKAYILYRENGKDDSYAVRGESIYMLSPPNNDYPLTKH